GPVVAAASGLDFVMPAPTSDVWRAPHAWRLARIDQPATWLRAGRAHSASVSADLGSDGVHGGKGSAQHRVRRPGHRLIVDNAPVEVTELSGYRLVEWQGRSYRLERPRALTVEETARDRGARGAGGRLTAPMPGRVVKVAVEVGQHVTQN